MDGAALNAGLICAEQDKHERGSHEHPARMRTARGPKIDDSTKQIRTANEQTARKPGILLEPVCSGDRTSPPRNQAIVLKCRSSGTSLLVLPAILLSARANSSNGLTMKRWTRMPCTTATQAPMIPAIASATFCQAISMHPFLPVGIQ